MRLLVDYGLGIWINALRGLNGKLGGRLIRAVGRMGMIGSERGGDRVIGSYGMKRECSLTISALDEVLAFEM